MLQDIRYAIRSLLKTPGFWVVAVVTLALGIGANTAMFSVVKAVLLARLPYPHPDELVQLWETAKDGHQMQVSGPNFLDWHDRNRSLAFSADGYTDEIALSGGIPPRRVAIAGVSRDFFDVMAVAPERGRVPTAAEHRVGVAPLVTISHSLWLDGFGGDPQILGRSVKLGGNVATIIGVMPPDFDFPERAQVWFPLEVVPDPSTRSAHNYHVFGRLKNGISVEAARHDLDRVAAQLALEYIDDKDHGIGVVSLHDQIVGPVRPALLILLAAVGFVLLIACVNIANLQMARGSTRAREMALRLALGAARKRLVRQLLTESLLLAAMGGVAGGLLAFWATGLLRYAVPHNVARIESIHVDGFVLSFTAAVSLCAGFLFGLLPAWSSSKADVNEALKEGSGKATSSAGSRRMGGALVISEIALAMVLLVGAGLLIQTFRNLERVDPGFSTKGVLTAEIAWPQLDNAPSTGYFPVTDGVRLTRGLIEKAAALPGIEAVGTINNFPIKGFSPDGSFEIAGRPTPADPHDVPDADYRVVTRDYFRALGIPLLRGRMFRAGDERDDVPQLALVSQSFVKEFYPHEDVIGKRIRFLGFDEHPQFLEIVGVVGDVRASNLTKAGDPTVYVDGFQHPPALSYLTLVARGPASSASAIRAIVQSLNTDVPVSFEPVERIIAESVSRQRFQMTLLAIFAGLALLLSAVGIYGVQSYTVNRRTNELGIRLALGADRGALLRLVLREGMVLAGCGVAIGCGGALLLMRTLDSFLYGVSAADPFTFGAIAGLLAGVALAACFLPARRAAMVDPMTALRYE
jgi:putative ABC transport system permease protein